MVAWVQPIPQVQQIVPEPLEQPVLQAVRVQQVVPEPLGQRVLQVVLGQRALLAEQALQVPK